MASKNDPHPLYQQIYQYLAEEIAAERLRPGDRVPSEKQLSVQFEVSRITSKKALEMLSDDGMIERIPGKGSFVIEKGQTAGGVVSRERGRLLGFVVPDFYDAFGTKLLCGIEEQCQSLGYHMVLHRTHDLLDREEKAIRSLLGIGVDGVIVLPVHGEHYNPVILRLILDRFPLVFVDRYLRGLAASTIITDNVEGAQAGTDHLIELGHRSIAFVSPTTEHTSTIEDRLEGFTRSHANHGLLMDRELLLTGVRSTMSHSRTEENLAADLACIEEHLSKHPEVTAVFAVEYDIAIMVRTVAARLGKSVPKELSILCFDSPAPHAGPTPFTHIRQQELQMGTMAVQVIHDFLGGDEEIKKLHLPAQLVIGESTAPPR